MDAVEQKYQNIVQVVFNSPRPEQNSRNQVNYIVKRIFSNDPFLSFISNFSEVFFVGVQ